MTIERSIVALPFHPIQSTAGSIIVLFYLDNNAQPTLAVDTFAILFYQVADFQLSTSKLARQCAMVIPEQQVLTIGSSSLSKPTIIPSIGLLFNAFHLTKLPSFTDYLQSVRVMNTILAKAICVASPSNSNRGASIVQVYLKHNPKHTLVAVVLYQVTDLHFEIIGFHLPPLCFQDCGDRLTRSCF
jgi:hypothetical protein